MFYVRRNPQGEVVALSREPATGMSECLPPDAPEVRAFLHAGGAPAQDAEALRLSDQDMARVMEDVIELLIERQVIRYTDLPEPAQRKLMHRQTLRARRRALQLLDGGDDTL